MATIEVGTIIIDDSQWEMPSDINGPIESEETSGITKTYEVHFYGNVAIYTIAYDFHDDGDLVIEHKEYALDQLLFEADWLADYE